MNIVFNKLIGLHVLVKSDIEDKSSFL